MTATYRVILAADSGSRASIAIAESAGGFAKNQVQAFDGTNDLAFIEVPDAASAAALESLMDGDDNVVSYKVVGQDQFVLEWIAQDGQGVLPMGKFGSAEEAEAAIPAARAELLAQCGSDEDRAGIEAGRFAVSEPV